MIVIVNMQPFPVNRQPALSGLKPDGIVIIKQDSPVILNNHAAASHKGEKYLPKNGILGKLQPFCSRRFDLFQQFPFTLPSFSL